MAELDTVAPVVWPKWCYSSNMESEAALSAEAISKVPVGRARRRKTNAAAAGPRNNVVVKKEVYNSPDFETSVAESCRSDSPSSPSGSSSARTASSFAGTPPLPLLTPLDRFSPSNLINQKILMEGIQMSRNYSELMRSLAAKYNNNTINNYTNSCSTTKSQGHLAFPLINIPTLSGTNNSTPKKKVGATVFSPGLPGSMQSAGAGQFPLMDMSSTQALLNIVRSANAQNSQKLGSPNSAVKRKADSTHPLDLSASVIKKTQSEPSLGFPDLSGMTKSPPEVSNSNWRTRNPTGCKSTCVADSCSSAAIEVNRWSVDEVVEYLRSIDVCAEYAQAFREHSIDGSILPLLTEDHLTSKLNMKLGPAIKFRSSLAQKIGHCALCLHCVHCHQQSDIDNNSVA